MSIEKAKAKSLSLLKEIDTDRYAEINGRRYDLLNFTHRKRVKVWAYFSSVSSMIESGNYGFMGSDEYVEIENIIFNHTAFEKSALTGKHFEKYEEDYLMFISVMLGAISYPFLAGSLTN
jgi:hypothetical protein